MSEKNELGYWFAVLKDEGDNDYGTGSYNLHEAYEISRQYNPSTVQIAIIDENNDPVCIDIFRPVWALADKNN